MKREKYSLKSRLLGEAALLTEGGDTKWGNGWKCEVAATIALNGTLRPNHLVGNHTSSAVSGGTKDKPGTGDIIAPGVSNSNEVKMLMQSSQNGTVAPDEAIIPLELTQGRMEKLDPTDTRAQLKRYAQRSRDWKSWRPAVGIDPNTGASIPGDSLGDFASVGDQMDEYLDDEIIVVYPGSPKKNRYCLVYHIKNPVAVRSMGMRSYNKGHRPASETIVKLPSNPIRVTYDQINQVLAQQGVNYQL
jgi:hypothetical protein